MVDRCDHHYFLLSAASFVTVTMLPITKILKKACYKNKVFFVSFGVSVLKSLSAVKNHHY